MELQLDATTEELQVFMAETDELLQVLDEQLVRLEQVGPSPELLQEVFRAAHTIKGSSASIGHTRMARLTHAMETLLDRMRRGELQPSPGLIEQLFAALDALKALAVEVQSLQQTDLDVEGLAGVLEAWASDASGAAPNPPPARAAIRPSTLAPPPEASHHVLLQFEPGPWASVRALQALLALGPVAEVLVSRPDRSVIESGGVQSRLEAWLHSEREVEELRSALEDVPETTVLSLGDRESALAQRGRGADEADDEPADWRTDGTRAAAGRGAATVRVDVARLDRLLNLVGELVIDRTRLAELERFLRQQVGESRLLSDLGETTLHLSRITDELQTEIVKSRMLPIATVFNRFPRVVRDLATHQGKRVELVVEGQETELDRSVIEEISDPLIHLLRNAIDHGVELPADRLAGGKRECATVRLAAEHVENSIVIVVEDDGRGVDAERVRAHAIERGLLTADAAARLSDGEAVDLIFLPGCSTATEISEVSGRGVGLDIVRTNVERLGGSVEAHTALGRGTRFVLRLPLTLAIVRALLVRVADSVCALPLSAVIETLRVPLADIQRMQRQEALVLRGRVLPVLRLAALFGRDDAAGRVGRHVLVVAVKAADRQVGLVVDGLLGEQEVVIKTLGPLIGQVQGISSAAILGDGSVALIVDVPGLVQRLVADRSERTWTNGREAAHAGLAVVADR